MPGPSSHTPLPIPLSAVEGVVWPAPAGGMQAVTLAALQQLEETQYLPPDELRARQFRQLALLLAHAGAKLPFYRDRFNNAGFDTTAPISADAWSRLPVLTREEVQAAGEAIHCRDLPRQHGETTTGSTSGSTATALKVHRSAIAIFFWNVFALRETAWHGFDLKGKLAAIRIDWARPAGSTGVYVKRHENWGPPLAALYPTGPAAVLDIRQCAIAEQAQWLRNEAPDHLVSFGVNLKVLARHCLAHGIRIPSLKTAYSQGEVLSDAARAACREAWGVKVVDNYSAVEAGQLAFECPEHPHLHVQSESAVVEILHADGTPCAPGEVGRVVVTPLHNFAMPLIRYAIGDLAEVGAPCPCGRTLPVIKRVLGRTRDMLVLPGGERRFPFYGQNVFAELPAVIQHQIVQKQFDAFEVRLVAQRRLNPDEEARLYARLREALALSVRVAFAYCESIERSPSGKFEEFRCEVGE